MSASFSTRCLLTPSTCAMSASFSSHLLSPSTFSAPTSFTSHLLPPAQRLPRQLLHLPPTATFHLLNSCQLLQLPVRSTSCRWWSNRAHPSKLFVKIAQVRRWSRSLARLTWLVKVEKRHKWRLLWKQKVIQFTELCQMVKLVIFSEEDDVKEISNQVLVGFIPNQRFSKINYLKDIWKACCPYFEKNFAKKLSGRYLECMLHNILLNYTN